MVKRKERKLDYAFRQKERGVKNKDCAYKPYIILEFFKGLSYVSFADMLLESLKIKDEKNINLACKGLQAMIDQETLRSSAGQ